MQIKLTLIQHKKKIKEKKKRVMLKTNEKQGKFQNKPLESKYNTDLMTKALDKTKQEDVDSKIIKEEDGTHIVSMKGKMGT